MKVDTDIIAGNDEPAGLFVQTPIHISIESAFGER